MIPMDVSSSLADGSLNMWLLAFALISVVIPTLLILTLSRILGKSAKKTIRVFAPSKK